MKVGIIGIALAVIAAVLWTSGVLTPAARNLLITEVSASPLANGGAAGVLTIENEGVPDRLIGVHSTMADVRFHNADRGLPVPLGKSSLALDAAHIMIAPTDVPLEDGTLVPLTLRFEAAGDVTAKARFTRPEPGSMAAHMAMGHSGMQHDVTQAPFPTVALSVSAHDQGWIAQIDAENFTFSEEMQDGDHVGGTGHGHIYIGDMKLGRVFSDSYSIGALPKGQHLLRVTLNTNDHRAYVVDGTPVSAEAIITVD